jgi:predicted Zn-dependent peptidase
MIGLLATLSIGACAAETPKNARKGELADDNPVVAPTTDKATVHLPASTDFRLANGMRVFLVPHAKTPLVSFQVRVGGGSVEDPAGKEGAADVLAALLSKGAGDRDAKAFEDAVEFVGGSFGSDAARRWISVSAEFLSRDADLGIELLGDALMRPKLDAKEFEKARGLAIDGIASARQEPNSIIGRYYGAWLFAGHPFARPTGGDEKSLAAVTLDDVKSAAARTLGPGRVWLAVAGDFDAAEMRKKLEARFGGWSAKTADPTPVPKFGGAKEIGALLVDMPGSLQTYFRFGNLGIDWSHPDYPARTVANTMLGSRFTSRLNKALRTDSGLTYGASSRFDDASQGAFVVSSFTATDVTRKTIDMAVDVYSKFVKDGMTQDELDSSRRYIEGQFATSTIETADQSASMILELEFDGLPRDLVDKYFERIDALKLDDVNRVIRERFPAPDAMTWVVIGQADKLRDYVKEFGKVTECKLADPGFGPAR